MSTVGENILEGLQDAVQYAKGKTDGQRTHKMTVPEDMNVKRIRQKLNMSQREFSEMFGFSIHSIRNWEQGKRHLQWPSRVFLLLISKAPHTVQQVLSDVMP